MLSFQQPALGFKQRSFDEEDRMDRQQRTETGWPGPDAELSLRTRLWARREQQRELAELSENKKMPKQGHFFVQKCVFLFFCFFSPFHAVSI